MTGETFDLLEYLPRFPEELLLDPKGRRCLTKYDPLLFALLYFPHHLRDREDGEVTLSDFHLDMCRRALTWVREGPRRDAEIAPRHSGKSTWNFLGRL